jgi:hypothetical protein
MSASIVWSGASAQKDVGIYTLGQASGLAVGDCLIFCIACDDSGTLWSNVDLGWSSSPTGTISHTGLNSLDNVDALNSGNVDCRIWAYEITALQYGANPYINVQTTDQASAASVYAIRGLDLDASPLDKSATSIGSGTTAGAGPTATLAQADEVGIGLIGMEEEADEVGTWTTGAGYVEGNILSAGTTGQGGASNISVFSVAEILSATTAQEVEQTATGDNDWAAVVAVFAAATGGGPTAPWSGSLAMMGVGR